VNTHHIFLKISLEIRLLLYAKVVKGECIFFVFFVFWFCKPRHTHAPRTPYTQNTRTHTKHTRHTHTSTRTYLHIHTRAHTCTHYTYYCTHSDTRAHITKTCTHALCTCGGGAWLIQQVHMHSLTHSLTHSFYDVHARTRAHTYTTRTHAHAHTHTHIAHMYTKLTHAHIRTHIHTHTHTHRHPRCADPTRHSFIRSLSYRVSTVVVDKVVIVIE